MSFLNVAPDVVNAASGDLANLGSSLRAAHAAAAAQTTAIAAPAADEVSAVVSSFFGSAGQQFQTVAAQAAAFHDEFVGALSAGAGQYVAAEAANVQQALTNAVEAPLQAVSGASGALTSAANTVTIPPLSINLPLLGNVAVSLSGTFPTLGTTGPFSGIANATNQLIGTASLSVNGTVAVLGPATEEVLVTGANLNAPTLINFLVAGAGPTVTGNLSLLNSTETFFSQIRRGDLLGAAITGVTAPANYLQAVTVGSTTVSVPIDTSAYGGPVGTLNIPFEGVFAPPQPITASWPTFHVTNGPVTIQVDGVTNLPIGSTSGFFPFLGQTLLSLI
ncbi:PE family protein [Mycobacterium sp. Marseille-P9652]|uniref:PE family protein n=1 Tax=Mycobacterium sp. Marseille-P9652 TaxID=2654950 RepID=UPI0012E8BC18|nr:PE family protein [Mycobacterium sp. Marseille-P9652]